MGTSVSGPPCLPRLTASPPPLQAAHVAHLLQRPPAPRVLEQGEAEGAAAEGHHLRQGLRHAVGRACGRCEWWPWPRRRRQRAVSVSRPRSLLARGRDSRFGSSVNKSSLFFCVKVLLTFHLYVQRGF